MTSLKKFTDTPIQSSRKRLQAAFILSVWRSARGKIVDVRLMPAKELKRPRIDVVVQTSGQFRDIAASRIFLISRAVDLASDAEDAPGSINHVREGTLLAEKVMKQKELSPLDARTFFRARVFGSVYGNYGTGIMGLVEAGDRWENNEEIAYRYLKNMGAIYTREHWGYYSPGIFEGALQHTDTVLHKRSSNVWGPLSLDHVYEFMGGISATVRQVTGNDPDVYFTDLCNRHNALVQGEKEVIWTETRTSVMNPKYIKALQKGGAFSAEKFAGIFRNTYGWNVMKPAEIDTELWEGLYDVHIKDTLNLGMKQYFRDKNPFALQEMSAVMLETIRKGYWRPDQVIIKTLAGLHAGLVKDFNPGCSGFLSPELSSAYNADIDRVRIGDGSPKIKGIKLEKEIFQLEKAKQVVSGNMPAIFTLLAIVVVFAAAVFIGARKHRGIHMKDRWWFFPDKDDRI